MAFNQAQTSCLLVGLALLTFVAVCKSAELPTVSVQLFGIKLTEATCPNLDKAIRARGATITTGELPADAIVSLFSMMPGGPLDSPTSVYKSEKLFESSDILALACTKSGALAFARYRLPSMLDTKQVADVAKLVAAKYGKPDDLRGKADMGEVEYRWKRGEVNITVHRRWPDTTTYLTYTVNAKLAELRAERKSKNNAETKQRAVQQSDAF
jgi:hypothetical protein